MPDAPLPGPRTDAEPATLTVLADGPYLLTGDIEIVDGAGRELRRASQVSLCRCGRSTLLPYCDVAQCGQVPSSGEVSR